MNGCIKRFIGNEMGAISRTYSLKNKIKDRVQYDPVYMNSESDLGIISGE